MRCIAMCIVQCAYDTFLNYYPLKWYEFRSVVYDIIWHFLWWLMRVNVNLCETQFDSHVVHNLLHNKTCTKSATIQTYVSAVLFYGPYSHSFESSGIFLSQQNGMRSSGCGFRGSSINFYIHFNQMINKNTKWYYPAVHCNRQNPETTTEK